MAAKGKTIAVRLNAAEVEMLEKLVQSRGGYENASEYIRTLLHHEHNKRAGLPTERRAADTAWRIGRPKQTPQAGKCLTDSAETDEKS